MSTIRCSVEISAATELVFDRWTRSDRLPTFVGGAADERLQDIAHLDWVPLVEGRHRDFRARVTDQVPGRHIAWDGDEAGHAGSVRFEPVGPERSRVTVELHWEPEGESAVADRLVVRRRLQDDLADFGRQVEAEREPAVSRAAPAAPPPPTPAAGRSARAAPADDDAGRGADSPTDIPPRGWLAVLKRTAAQLKSDNASVVAAGVAFYIFLALVPALIAVISVYGLVADPADIERQLGSLLSAMPTEAADLVRAQVTTITAQGSASLGLGLVVSVVVALVGASKGMLALMTALDIAYDEEETRTFLRLRAEALLFTLGLAVAAVLGVGGMVVAGNLAAGLGTVGEVAVNVLRWPLLAGLVVVGLAVLYRYGPDRDKAPWRWVTPGALVATVLWLVGSVAFTVYVANFGKYNETYGSLGAVVVLLLWLSLTAYAIVFGAELDMEVERQAAG